MAAAPTGTSSRLSGGFVFEGRPRRTVRTLSHAEMSSQDTYEFIRTCISHVPDEVRRKKALAFIGAGPDWDLVCREASRHGVLLLLFHNLETLVPRRLPAPLLERVHSQRRLTRIHAAFLMQELGKVSHLFGERNLPFLVLKGPVLSQIAYGDVAMRRYVDLDIVVPKSRFSEVDQLLQANGYEYWSDRKKLTGWRKKFALYLSGQWPFKRGQGTFNIDVHTRIMPPGYTLSADFQEFWDRSQSICLDDGPTVQRFSSEDMGLILAYHGIKNQWRKLKHVADIAGLIRADIDLDWSALRQRAATMDGTRVMKLGLRMVNDVMETSLPKSIQSWINDRSLEDLSSLMQTHLQDRRQSTLSYGDRVRLQLAAKDTFAAQMRYGLYSAMQHVWSSLLKP